MERMPSETEGVESKFSEDDNFSLLKKFKSYESLSKRKLTSRICLRKISGKINGYPKKLAE